MRPQSNSHDSPLLLRSVPLRTALVAVIEVALPVTGSCNVVKATSPPLPEAAWSW